MKKLLLPVLLIGLASCQKNAQYSESSTPPPSKFKTEMDGGCLMGEMHNDFMTYTLNNFQPDSSINNLSDAVDYVDNFELNYLSNYDLPDSTKEYLSTQLVKYKDLVIPHQVEGIDSGRVLIENPILGGKTTLTSLISSLNNSQVISRSEAMEFDSLIDFSKKAFAGEITNAELSSYLQRLNDKVDTGNYEILGTVSCIANASYQWWTEHPEAQHGSNFGPQPQIAAAVAAVVARDAVGAAISGAGSAAAQYASNGKVNWKTVAYSAGIGAIAGSVGVIAKVGSWVASLF